MLNKQIYPENLKNQCCGMAFDSKGFKQLGLQKIRDLEEALLKASNNGEYPVLCDMSPCLLRMKDLMDKRLQLMEPIEFSLINLSDKLKFEKQDEPVIIHATCSTTKMGLEEKLLELAEMWQASRKSFCFVCWCPAGNPEIKQQLERRT